MSGFGLGMLVGFFLGLGLSIFFRWSEDGMGMTFIEWLDLRSEWVKKRNNGETDEGFDRYLINSTEEEK